MKQVSIVGLVLLFSMSFQLVGATTTTQEASIFKSVIAGNILENLGSTSVKQVAQTLGSSVDIKATSRNFLVRGYVWLNDKLFPAEQNKDFFDKIGNWLKTIPQRVKAFFNEPTNFEEE